MRDTLDGYNKGFVLEAELLTTSDDVTLIATAALQELQELNIAIQMKLIINTANTKSVVSVNCKGNSEADYWQWRGGTSEFTRLPQLRLCRRWQLYSGHKKLTLGRTMMQSLATIWRSKDVTKPTKICLLKVVAWPVAYMDARAGLITQKRRTAH